MKQIHKKKANENLEKVNEFRNKNKNFFLFQYDFFSIELVFTTLIQFKKNRLQSVSSIEKKRLISKKSRKDSRFTKYSQSN